MERKQEAQVKPLSFNIAQAKDAKDKIFLFYNHFKRINLEKLKSKAVDSSRFYAFPVQTKEQAQEGFNFFKTQKFLKIPQDATTPEDAYIWLTKQQFSVLEGEGSMIELDQKSCRFLPHFPENASREQKMITFWEEVAARSIPDKYGMNRFIAKDLETARSWFNFLKTESQLDISSELTPRSFTYSDYHRFSLSPEQFKKLKNIVNDIRKKSEGVASVVDKETEINLEPFRHYIQKSLPEAKFEISKQDDGGYKIASAEEDTLASISLIIEELSPEGDKFPIKESLSPNSYIKISAYQMGLLSKIAVAMTPTEAAPVAAPSAADSVQSIPQQASSPAASSSVSSASPALLAGESKLALTPIRTILEEDPNLEHVILGSRQVLNRFKKNSFLIARIIREKKETSKPIKVYVSYSTADGYDGFDTDPRVAKEKLEKTLHTRSTNEKTGLKFELEKTKNRTVTSEVTFYATLCDDQIIKEGFPVIVTTACAPNAMTTWSPDQKIYFTKEEEKGGYPAYQVKMFEIYQNILLEQIKQGVEVLIIPPLGMGVYLDTLNNTQKAAVIRANCAALNQAIAAVHPGYLNYPLKEIVMVAPDFSSTGRNVVYETAQKVFADGATPIPVTVAKVEALAAALRLHKKGHKVGLVNLGSYSTVGGGYIPRGDELPEKMGQLTRLMPAEETFSNSSDLVEIQSLDFPSRTKSYVYTTYNPAQLKKVLGAAPQKPKLVREEKAASVPRRELELSPVGLENKSRAPSSLSFEVRKQAIGTFLALKEDKGVFKTISDSLRSQKTFPATFKMKKNDAAEGICKVLDQIREESGFAEDSKLIWQEDGDGFLNCTVTREQYELILFFKGEAADEGYYLLKDEVEKCVMDPTEDSKTYAGQIDRLMSESTYSFVPQKWKDDLKNRQPYFALQQALTACRKRHEKKDEQKKNQAVNPKSLKEDVEKIISHPIYKSVPSKWKKKLLADIFDKNMAQLEEVLREEKAESSSPVEGGEVSLPSVSVEAADGKLNSSQILNSLKDQKEEATPTKLFCQEISQKLRGDLEKLYNESFCSDGSFFADAQPESIFNIGLNGLKSKYVEEPRELKENASVLARWKALRQEIIGEYTGRVAEKMAERNKQAEAAAAASPVGVPQSEALQLKGVAAQPSA